MDNWVKNAVNSVTVIAVLFLNGCVENVSARLDREESQATANRPVSTEVEVVSISSDPSLPTYIVVVEPFMMGASGVTAGPKTGLPILNPGEQIGPGVAAQLVTSLRKVGNLVVVDHDIYQRDPGRVVGSLQSGEQGPFLIRGTVTEFSEIADASIKGESTGPNILSLFIPYVGGLVSYGIGTKAKSEAKHVGMVGLDIQIVDPATGRLLTSLTAEGSFTSVSVTKSRTRWAGPEVTPKALPARSAKPNESP